MGTPKKWCITPELKKVLDPLFKDGLDSIPELPTEFVQNPGVGDMDSPIMKGWQRKSQDSLIPFIAFKVQHKNAAIQEVIMIGQRGSISPDYWVQMDNGATAKLADKSLTGYCGRVDGRLCLDFVRSNSENFRKLIAEGSAEDLNGITVELLRNA